MSLPLTQLTLSQAGESVRRRDVTSVALTEAALDRAETVQPALKCCLRIDREPAREALSVSITEAAFAMPGRCGVVGLSMCARRLVEGW